MIDDKLNFSPKMPSGVSNSTPPPKLNSKVKIIIFVLTVVVVIVLAKGGTMYYSYKKHDVCYKDSHCYLDTCSGAVHNNAKGNPSLPCMRHTTDRFSAQCVENQCTTITKGTESVSTIENVSDITITKGIESVSTIENAPELRARVAEEGSILVIVSLKTFVPFEPGEMSESEKSQVLSEAHAARDVIIAGIEPLGATNVKLFKFIPHFAVTVNSDSLEFLLSSPYVEGIQEDVPQPLSGGMRSGDI